MGSCKVSTDRGEIIKVVIRFKVDWCTLRSLVQHGGDAEDEVSANVSHLRLDDALAVLQTTITLESFPSAVPAGVSSL